MVSKFSFKLDKNLSPRSKAQEAINEINYGVSELIDMRMDIANSMEQIDDLDDEEEDDDRIVEEPLEESPCDNRRMIDIKGFNIKA